MSDFDQKDIIAPVPSAKKAVSDFAPEDVLTTSPGSDFDSQDVLHSSTPREQSSDFDQADVSTDPEYAKVKRVQDRSFWSAPLLSSETTTDTEIEAIARKYKIDPATLKEMATFGGAIREDGKRDVPGELTSSVARGVALNIPQFAAKKSLDDVNLRKAFDEIQDLADQKRSFARGLAENVIPVGAAANMVARGVGAAGEAVAKQSLGQAMKRSAAEGAAIGGVAGGARSHEGQELRSTATGILLGAPLGAGASVIGHGIGKMFSGSEKELAEGYVRKNSAEIDKGTAEILEKNKATDDAVLESIVSDTVDAKELLDASTPSGKLLKEYYPDGTSAETRVANGLVEKDAVGLARMINPESTADSLAAARREITEFTERQGGRPALENKWNTYKSEEAALDYIRNQGIHQTRGDSWANKTLNFVSDAQFVLRDIGDRFGVRLEPVHHAVNRAMTRMSFPRNVFRADIADIYRANKAIDSELTKGTKVYTALDSGNTSALSPAELNAFDQIKGFFSKGLKFANEEVQKADPSINPLSIPVREHYVPHMLEDADKLIPKFDQKFREVLEDASAATGRRIDDVIQLHPSEFEQLAFTSQATKDLLEGLELLNNRKITSPQELSTRFKEQFLNSDRGIKMETAARAAMERNGIIPEWMREKNLFLLMDKWTTNTLRHLYLRNSLDELGSLTRRVRAAGGKLEADYLERLLQDINGVRKGTAASGALEAKISFNRMIDAKLAKTTNVVERAGLQMAKAVPEVFSDLSKQIYPNLLGLSPRALIMNSTQLFAKTWPELGTTYGSAVLPRGMLSALKNYPAMRKRLRDSGFQPAEFINKYRQATSEGIRRSSFYAMPLNVVSAAGDAAMKLYTKMDEMNRIIAMSTADMMAHDLAKGSNFARKSLANFPETIQREVSLAGGDEKAISAIISAHLNASTQYNYNRASMSEFGRTMGPMFSVFSKWPTATVGEAIAEYRKRGFLGGSARNAEKFVVPLLAFQLFDTLALNEGFTPYNEDTDEKTDIQKKLFSNNGMSQAAPIGAAKGVLEGDFFTPPMIDVALRVLMATAQADPMAAMRGVDAAVNQYMPGSVWLRFLTDDLLTLQSGERPEGTTFTERTIEGARRLQK
jgi:hypothetical protein